jgi:chromosome segregation ATPase
VRVTDLDQSRTRSQITTVDGAIVAELVAARHLVRQQTERIKHLEQALDQTMASLEDAQQRLAEQEALTAHLAATEETANVQQQAILQLKHQLSQKDMVFNQLVQTRRSTEERDQQWLETELAKHLQHQALLQQACQELEQAREIQLARIAELEQQAAEMQEQILSQVQQAREAETAIQHWKDRYTDLHQHMLLLRQTLDSLNPQLPPEVWEILHTLAETPEIDAPPQRGIRPYQDLSVDLPDFLKRWQRREESG